MGGQVRRGFLRLPLPLLMRLRHICRGAYGGVATRPATNWGPGRAAHGPFVFPDPALSGGATQGRSRQPPGTVHDGSITRMSRIKGTVKWFNDAKGFGFITPED